MTQRDTKRERDDLFLSNKHGDTAHVGPITPEFGPKTPQNRKTPLLRNSNQINSKNKIDTYREVTRIEKTNQYHVCIFKIWLQYFYF